MNAIRAIPSAYAVYTFSIIKIFGEGKNSPVCQKTVHLEIIIRLLLFMIFNQALLTFPRIKQRNYFCYECGAVVSDCRGWFVAAMVPSSAVLIFDKRHSPRFCDE